jgi:thymidylate kinase
MQQIIIFDSPDGTGKTNIAQSLSARLHIPYFKMNTEHQNWRAGKFKTALEFDQTYLLQFLKQTGHSVIIDRAYPAEWVYSKVFKRETNDDLLEEIDRGFAELRTNIVIPLRRDYSKNRADELVSNDKLPELHAEYQRFSRWSKCRSIQIHVDDFGNALHAETDFICRYLRFED